MIDLLRSKSAFSWVRNGVIALAISGAYSIFLVVLRTPYLNKVIIGSEIFKSALVVHVNLSVLVWLVSISAALWSCIITSRLLNNICSYFALIGLILMGCAPLFGQNLPVMNNYIPMLENIIFIIGLSLFSVTILLFAICTVVDSYQFIVKDNGLRLIRFVSFSSACIYILAWICFVWSFFKLQEVMNLIPIDIEFYYELLFWSGGHALQFLYTQNLMLIWIVLIATLTKKEASFNNIYFYLFILNFLSSLAVLPGHFHYIMDYEFKEYFTLQMKYLGGIAPLGMFALLLGEYMIHKKENLLSIDNTAGLASFICSSILFMVGGIIGVLISETNVTIPAHYHGSIVGISIAYMGMVYYLLKIGSKLQIYILTIGQFLHISGLALAGGYGVLRKTPGEDFTLSAKVAMGVMGGGGLIAIIGGLMFVYICAKHTQRN